MTLLEAERVLLALDEPVDAYDIRYELVDAAQVLADSPYERLTLAKICDRMEGKTGYATGFDFAVAAYCINARREKLRGGR